MLIVKHFILEKDWPTGLLKTWYYFSSLGLKVFYA